MESRSILFLEKFCVSDSSCRISTVSEFFCHHCFFCVSPICLIPPVESSGRAARNCTLKCSVATRPIFSFSFLLYHLSDLRTSHGHLVASFYSFCFGALVSVQQVDCCLACQFGHVQFDTFLDPPVWLWRPVDFPFCVNVVRFISIHFPPYSDLRLSFSLFLILGLCGFAIFLSHWLAAVSRRLCFVCGCGRILDTFIFPSFVSCSRRLWFPVSASYFFQFQPLVTLVFFHFSKLRRLQVDVRFFTWVLPWSVCNFVCSICPTCGGPQSISIFFGEFGGIFFLIFLISSGRLVVSRFLFCFFVILANFKLIFF